MSKTALIFGAGKTGRGFAAHLAFLGGYDIVLIDKNRQLVADLKYAGQYHVQILGNETMSCTIPVTQVYHVGDASWQDAFAHTSLVFTAVYGNNLEALATDLAVAFQKRHWQNPDLDLTVITCENLTNAACFLKDEVVKHLDEEHQKWLLERVGFSGSIIFKTCIEAGKNQSPLTIRAQNFFELPCDGDAIKGELTVYGLQPLKRFRDQLKRKIYTYNCINAVITYLGAIKGYTQLYDAGNDAEILVTARKAAIETCRAQVAEFHFDPLEQDAWMHAAFAKFADRDIPDPIERNGADPARKLGRDDRLIGPALLAVKHGIYPEGLLAGIMACFQYTDAHQGGNIAGLLLEKGTGFVLTSICGLSPDEKLFMLISQQIVKSNLHGKN